MINSPVGFVKDPLIPSYKTTNKCWFRRRENKDRDICKGENPIVNITQLAQRQEEERKEKAEPMLTKQVMLEDRQRKNSDIKGGRST